MTAPRAAEAAVSSVVGAVLLVALFTTAMTIWTFQTLPEWEADREQAHQRQVVADLGALKSDLEGLSLRESPGPASRAIDLGVPSVPLIQVGKAHGTLAFRPGASASVAFGSPSIVLLDGKPTVTPSASANGAQLSSVAALDALTVAIASDRVNAQAASAWVRATATDGATSVSATVSHAGGAAGCQGAALTLAITSTITTTSVLQCGLDDTLPATPVDLLLSAYGFRGALSRLSTPFTVTLAQGSTSGAQATGTYTAVWTDDGGVEHAVGDGLALPFSLDLDGGSVAWDPAYLRFADQAAAWELGGIVLDQPGGQVVVGHPPFALESAAGQGYLRWTLVELSGSGSVSGTQKGTITVTHRTTSEALVRADSMTLTILSEHAEAWQGFLADRILLSEAAGAASVSATADSATLALTTGPTLPVTDGWLIHLRIIHADAVVT